MGLRIPQPTQALLAAQWVIGAASIRGIWSRLIEDVELTGDEYDERARHLELSLVNPHETLNRRTARRKMATDQTFAEALGEAGKRQGRLKRRLIEAVLSNPEASAAAERAVRNKLGVKAGQKVDYGALDWAALLPLILQILPQILALFQKK